MSDYPAPNALNPEDAPYDVYNWEDEEVKENDPTSPEGGLG